ncbi:MAG: right-handed parallel beta-helix repeat-containing protein [Micromonosporaceae bacterium]|nr:right-handed parallel beta-helix repeat-containing protein [Micromonosporaceae bacterium]
MAAVIVASGIVAADAAAADVTDLWVNGSNTNCSDAGPGTQAQPFCTLAVAAEAVSAGQTVHVTGSYHEHLTIAKSGTPDAPIVFTGTSPLGTGLPGITLDAQHDVTISQFAVGQATGSTGISVSQSNHITLANDRVAGDAGISVSQSSQITLTDDSAVLTGTDAPAIVLSAVTDATVAHTTTQNAGGPGLVLDATTSGAIVTHLRANQSGVRAAPADGIDILGPDNTVVDSDLRDSSGAAMYVGPQADRTVVADNAISANAGIGVDVAGGVAVAVTNNNVYGNCAGGIRVRGGATDTSVQNNIVTRNGSDVAFNCSQGQGQVSLGVYDGATASSIVDYNIVYQTTPGEYPYGWGDAKATLADFQTASGQGQHDIQADPRAALSAPATDSPALDSANSAAPGWQPKDHDGLAAVDDIDRQDTGAGPVTYADRGAFELKAPVIAAVTATAHPGDPVSGWPISADASASSPGWSTIVSYQFNFGDGTSSTSTTALVDHVYQSAGTYQVSLTITAADGRSNTTSTPASVVVGDLFQPAGPVRILDTRAAVGVSTKVPVPAHGTVHLRVAGANGVPATGVAAVVLNTTVTATTAGGYLTAYPDGVPRPTTSNTNWTAGRTVANLVTVKVVNGVVDLYNGSPGSVHFVADLAGYYAHSTGLTFSPAQVPQRILDTRTGLGGWPTAVPAHGTISLSNDFPPGTSQLLNVTVTGATASGYLTVYPDGPSRPVASNLNWTTGQTVANVVVVSAPDGVIDFYNGSNRPVHVIADALGGFWQGLGQPFVPANPVRLLDTRIGTSPLPVAPHGTISLTLARGSNGIPARGATAVILSVTVTRPTAGGYLTVYPGLYSPPTASNLNWTSGATVANLVVVAINGGVQFYNGSPGTIHIVVDLVGSYTL